MGKELGGLSLIVLWLVGSVANAEEPIASGLLPVLVHNGDRAEVWSCLVSRDYLRWALCMSSGTQAMPQLLGDDMGWQSPKHIETETQEL